MYEDYIPILQIDPPLDLESGETSKRKTQYSCRVRRKTVSTLQLKVVLMEQLCPQEQTSISSLLVILLKAQEKLQWFVNTVICLILIYHGSSPLVHLLIQSSHWITARPHYCFSAKQLLPSLAGLDCSEISLVFHEAHTVSERGVFMKSNVKWRKFLEISSKS